ncbi:MAG: hypothetical protein K8T91_26500 [Planctomycetes bacterium]|nr:hypothetical protein [Planctomycetota bacterium]
MPPILFLVLMGVCAIAIVVAAVMDMMPERAADGEGEAQEDTVATSKKQAKAEKLKAKAEEKAKKKAAQKASKAGKAKKGKSKTAPTPVAEPSESEPVGEVIDFSEPA